jgi:hypothetical protein
VDWVCRHRRHGAVLALIALALQIVLAFGHVHLHAAAQNPHARSAQRVALADTKSRAPAQIPADNDDYCAICASILASSAFAPAPPQLLVPANFQRIEHCFSVARPLTHSPRLAFRSRAPPVV